MKLKSNKIRRNSPCPCGSGKKLKRCCLGKVRKFQWATDVGLTSATIIVDRVFGETGTGLIETPEVQA